MKNHRLLVPTVCLIGLSTQGCTEPEFAPTELVAAVREGGNAVELSWIAPTSDGSISELRVVRCLDPLACPTDRVAAAANDADDSAWGARCQDVTEVQIPRLRGPFVYPDDVDGLGAEGTPPCETNAPLPPPALVAGARYVAFSFTDASTMVWRLESDGRVEFDVPVE